MSDSQSGIQGFIKELRRRRVFRVAAVYLGAAFVILEASEMIFPRMGLPDWTVSFVLGLLGLGFPVALILAWAFEVTPDGLNRAQKTDNKQTPDQKPMTSNLIITVLLVVIAGLLAYPQFFSSGSDSSVNESSADPKSIAVLPFTSFSESKESEYFSDGITDVILTQLAKIRDLKVISRTSIMQYKGTQKPIKEIASELGVAHILEGSVQRAGDKVRIVSQLIKADSDEHVWAETYTRDYADIFDLQSDVARAIATAMKATLTPAEESYLKEKPTDNQKAWDLYVQAIILRDDVSTGDRDEVMELLNQAADLDLEFLLPRANLVRFYANSYFNRRKTAGDDLSKAKQRLEEMLAINPNVPETHLAQGYYHYYASLEFEKARDEFLVAQQNQPNNSDLFEALAYINRRLGNWDEAYAALTKSVELDPNAGGKLGNLLQFSLQMRKWDAVQRYTGRLILMDKSNSDLLNLQLMLAAIKRGSIQDAQEELDRLSLIHNEEDLVEARESFAYFTRDFQTAIAYTYQDTSDRMDTRARYYHLLGNSDSTHFYADSIRKRTEKRLSEGHSIYWMHTALGGAYAALGDREAALESIANAKESVSLSEDALAGTSSMMGQANIYVLLGDYDEALKIYEQLLEIPSVMNIRFLMLDPWYDVLRDHPRYKALVKKYKPKEWADQAL